MNILWEVTRLRFWPMPTIVRHKIFDDQCSDEGVCDIVRSSLFRLQIIIGSKKYLIGLEFNFSDINISIETEFIRKLKSKYNKRGKII